MASLPIERLITGAAAWLLADCRHGHAKTVQLDLLPGGRLKLSSDGSLCTSPGEAPSTVEGLLTQRGWRFTDGRVDFPELLDACAEWSLVTPARVDGAAPKRGILGAFRKPESGSKSVILEGIHAKVTARKEATRPGSGTTFTFTPDAARTAGKVASPEVLTALRSQALTWPDAKFVVKLPGHEGWHHDPGAASGSSDGQRMGW